MTRTLRVAALAAFALLAACDPGPTSSGRATLSLGGTVSGLAGQGLVLASGTGQVVAIRADGTFAFPARILMGTRYAVTVATQPRNPIQACTVSGGAGVMGTVDVTSVEVTCATAPRPYTLGGTVAGLAGQGLVLSSGTGDELAVTASGSFTFPTSLASGTAYDVTVKTQPTSPTQTCAVVGGTGTVGASDVTSVAVTCVTSTYRVGGTVAGLAAGATLVVRNGGDDLSVGANGPFCFPTPVASGAAYDVTVIAQPTTPPQTCTVTGGTGTVGSGDVTTVAVACVADQFTIGGTVAGLTGTGLVLQDNAGDDLPVSASGAFTFATPVPRGGTYAVTVLSQPVNPAQVCTVSNGTGTVTTASVTSVAVTCTSGGPPALAVLATFTGTVDFTAGTMTLAIQPVGGTPVAPLTLALSGAPWINAAGSAHGCGPQDRVPAATVWGADVSMALRSVLPEAPSYSGLRAVVTAMFPATGLEPCSAVPPADLPAGITTSYGAFSFATLDTAIRVSDTRPWAFRGPGTGTATFSGSILGAEISDGPPWAAPRNTGLASSATRVFYPTDGGQLAVLDGATGAETLSAPLVAPGTVVAASTAGDRAWVATDPVGGFPWIQIVDTTGAITAGTEVAGSQPLAAIVADPLVADRAWFVAPGAPAGTLGSISGATGTLGRAVALGGADPFALAFGPDGNVYVTLRASQRIQVCSTAGTCNPVLIDPTAVAGCESPVAIILGPAVSGVSKLWFTSTSGTGAVCTLDPANANAIAKVASTAGIPDSLVLGPDGNVWVTSMAMNPAYVPPLPEGILERLLASGTEASRLMYVVGEDAWQVASSASRLWVIHRNAGGTLTSDLSRVTFLQ